MFGYDLHDPAWKTAGMVCNRNYCKRILSSADSVLVAADNDIVIAASYWEIQTVSQMFMLILLIADLGGAFNMIAQVLIWVSLVLTIVSLIDYIAKNVQVLTQGGM